MTGLRIAVSRMLALFARPRHEAELHDEIQAHLDLLADGHVRRGMSPAAARAAARREFGGVDQVKETYRDQRGLPWLDTLAQDVRYAARAFTKAPGFALTIVLMLALAIGATTTVFSVLNAVTFRSLPVPHPEELYLADQQGPTSVPLRFSFPSFERLKASTAGSAAIAAMSRVALAETDIDGRRSGERLRVQLVSGEYFSVLALSPAFGRTLTADDNRGVGGHPVAVVSHALWRRRFGALPDVLGRDVSLNGARFTIVGVAPEGFAGVWLESPADVWIPLVMQDDVRYAQNYSVHNGDDLKPFATQEGIEWLQIVARAPSSRLALMRASLDAHFQREMAHLAESYTGSFHEQLLRRRVTLTPLARGLSTERNRLTTPLVALLAMVTIVLLIACANAANLLLARAAARRRELAIRLSMGASRVRLARQLLTESAMLVCGASVMGTLLAYWGSIDLARRLVGAAPGRSPFPPLVDGRVLTFTVMVSVATVLLCALAPAVRATRHETADVLRGDTRTMRSGARLTASKLLVALQVALSLTLVVGAGLFGRSLLALTRIRLGFEPDRILSVRLNPRASRYTEAELPALYQRLVERVEILPGVQSAVVASCPLVTGCHDSSTISVATYQPRPGEEVRFGEYGVGPGYFSTVGIRLVAGRAFGQRDTDRAPKVAIVNQTAARRYFADRGAIGQRFSYGEQPVEIVGVVEDARVNSVQEPPGPMAYYPLGQRRNRYASALEVRTDGAPRAIVEALRKAVADVSPALLVDRITATAEQVDQNLRQERIVAQVTGGLGLLALALASFGLFGVMSYNVARRTGELGVRFAIGATRVQVLWMVLRESIVLALTGLAIGIPAVLVASRLVSGLLFGVAPNDPATIAAAVAVLIGVATLAGLVPAWKASRVDPIVALRQE